jgi:hypothetical protein
MQEEGDSAGLGLAFVSYPQVKTDGSCYRLCFVYSYSNLFCSGSMVDIDFLDLSYSK